MKTKISHGNRGSILLISLLFAALIGISLVSYITLISQQHVIVARQQAWNDAMPVAEAGVEEAMEQLFYNGTNNLTTNGWTLKADGMYYQTRTLSGNSYYKVAIQPGNPPIIWSIGNVSAPLATSGIEVNRLVRVSTTNMLYFGRGITAKGSIAFTGGAHLDSYSVTNGVYDLVGTGQAVALTDSSAAGAISMSGGYIGGSAVTGPTNPGTAAISINNADVGTESFIASNSTAGIQPGHYTDNANFQFNDPSAPSLSSPFTSFTTSGGTNYAGTPGHTTTYKMATFTTGNNTQPLIVNGNVTVYFTQTGNNVLVVQGSGFIQIMTNSTLTIYTAGNVTVSGGGIVNGAGFADDFTLYGLPTCATITYSGSANFIGVVDAPEANFTFSGGEIAIGAFVVNTVIVQGGTSGVFWDSSLGGTPGYAVASWNEMPVSTMP